MYHACSHVLISITVHIPRDKNESKDKMKGKNKPTRRHRKKQENVIRDRNQEIR